MTQPVPASPRSLEGRSVVVTGASRGLGRAMARALAAEGAVVAVTGRDLDALAETVRLIETDGGQVRPYALDVTDAEAVEAAAGRIWADLGGVDVVIANAGISLTKPAVETETAEFARIIDTNVNGTFSTVRSFGSRMLEQGHGKVITIASDIGIRGSAGWVAYASSKGAVITMTKSLAWEWAPAVTVNSIAPGAFATDINSHLLGVDEILAAIEQETPLGRVGRADEIGPLSVFLAGPGSDFMTGQIVSLDGGIQRS